MVRVVTDSTSDIPRDLAQALGITVVPAYVHFGSKSYRDGVDIGPDELYKRMLDGPVHPTTSAPAPGDFAEAYRKLSAETDEIISIVVTSKHSAVYDSALLGRESIKGRCRIEVVDSQLTTMGLGLVAMTAARMARDGRSMTEVLEGTRQAIPRIHGMALVDTLKYALKGGRLNKAGTLIGALVKVKPMLVIESGVIKPSGVTRTREKGLERLMDFVRKHLPLEEVAVVHSTSPDEAQSLAQRIQSVASLKAQPVIARLGSALGVHGGPGALAVALREGDSEAGEAVDKERRVKRFSVPSLRRSRR